MAKLTQRTFGLNNSLFKYYLIRGNLCSKSFSRYYPLLKFKEELDRFNGITIDVSNEEIDQSRFDVLLQESLNKWRTDGRRCIWFRVPVKESFIIPILAKQGFDFHHARNSCVMMYKWLPHDSKPNLPPSTHTNLGVGAMVFNNKNQMLAISEKHYDYPHWKLPGGYVEHGENITEAAKREVKEETGVNCEFDSLITFRHNHNMMFGNSDIYVLLKMRATSDVIQVGQREVLDCKWMDVKEYTTHPHVHKWNRYVVNKALEYEKLGIKLNIKHDVVQWASYTRDMNYLVLEM